jgi:hypothetical protein
MAWLGSLLNRLRKNDGDVAPQSSQARDALILGMLNYDIAYSVIPSCIFGSGSDEFVQKLFEWPLMGSFIYSRHCQLGGIEPVQSMAQQYHTHPGSLDPERAYCVLEFPLPSTAFETRHILEPYFSIVLKSKITAQLDYFVLGQAPMEGATLRQVTGVESHRPVARVREPTLENLLDKVREVLTAPPPCASV